MTMKKTILFLCLMILGTTYLAAQRTVTGKVVDRDGNPIPGAKVSIVGTEESVITELDGTFNFESQYMLSNKKVKVEYVGMQSKEQCVTPDMVVKLVKLTLWNAKLEKRKWFVNAQIAFPESGGKNLAYGLMIGRVKKWGWYVKGLLNFSPSTVGYYNNESSSNNKIWITGNTKTSYLAITAGGVANLYNPIFAYAGIGYSKRRCMIELLDGSYIEENCYFPYSGVIAEGGVMLKLGMLSINGGVLVDTYWTNNVTMNLGVGLFF